jgi:6-pyruvoyltetrahydropterin/6-carboxytetrahydropterin synthase
MTMTTLTRRYHFPASHRLNLPELSLEENQRLFGKCNYPFGHGHDYVLEVTVAGVVDEQTGLIVRVAEVDQLVREKVLQLFAYRYINVDVPQFAALVPTTENIALVIGDLLEKYWPAYIKQNDARLARVHVQETDRNGFEILFAVPAKRPVADFRAEYVLTSR